MNKQITEMLSASEGRYMTKAELALLRDFAAQLDSRLVAMEEIASKEETIIEQTVRLVMDAYPDFEKRHKEAAAKGARDLSLVLRYAAHAMLRGDAQYLEDMLLTWFRTILKGIGFTGNFIEDTYKTLDRIAIKELSPQTGTLLHPFLLQVVQTLSGRPQRAAEAKG